MRLLLAAIFIFCITLPLSAQDTEAEKIRSQNIQVVKMAAKELSVELPKKVDEYTSLVSIDAKGENLIYTFEIDTGVKKDETIIAEAKERKMGERILRGICRSSKRFIESGIDISYVYRSAAGKGRLFRFDADRKVCESLYGPAYFNP